MGGGGVDIASCCSLGVKLVVMYLCCLFFAALMLACCDRFLKFSLFVFSFDVFDECNTSNEYAFNFCC
jgi:hypothetical protein